MLKRVLSEVHKIHEGSTKLLMTEKLKFDTVPITEKQQFSRFIRENK